MTRIQRIPLHAHVTSQTLDSCFEQQTRPPAMLFQKHHATQRGHPWAQSLPGHAELAEWVSGSQFIYKDITGKYSAQVARYHHESQMI